MRHDLESRRVNGHQAMRPRAAGQIERRLPEELFERVRCAGSRRTLASGVQLFSEGDQPGSVYAIVSGRVRLYRTTADGRQILLDERGPGHLVGEISAIDHRPRSASAVAIESTIVSVIPGAVFSSMVDHDPLLAMATMRMISDRLRASNDTRNAWRNPDIVARLATQLVQLVTDAAEVIVNVSHEDLAGWIGVNRETVTRSLARLRTDGLIETARGRIAVLDIVGLQRRAGLADA